MPLEHSSVWVLTWELYDRLTNMRGRCRAMEAFEDSAGISRRTALKGAAGVAWMVPVVIVVAAPSAAAASGPPPEGGGGGGTGGGGGGTGGGGGQTGGGGGQTGGGGGQPPDPDTTPTVAHPVAGSPEAAAAVPASPSLAFTGANITDLAALGAVVTAVGAASIAAGSRLRRAEAQAQADDSV